MKADAAQLRRALAAPPAGVRLYLFHGPDEAGSAAAAAQLTKALGDTVERVDFDGAALRRDPGKLADEAASLSLFGAARLMWANRVGEESLEALSLLLAGDRPSHPTVALAPGVRSTAKIVKLAIDSPAALAAAFYEPTAAEAERIAAGIARDHGLIADAGTARRIAESAGGDRAMITREVEKLALFLDAEPDRPRPLDHAALDAIGADPGEAALDDVVAALVGGDPAALGTAFERIGAAGGGSPIPWLRAVARRLLTLAAMRSEIDAGEALAAVMKRHRIFFREEAATAAALRRWPAPRLAAAIAGVRAAERGAMAGGAAGTVLAESAAVAIARESARRR